LPHSSKLFHENSLFYIGKISIVRGVGAALQENKFFWIGMKYQTEIYLMILIHPGEKMMMK